MFKVRERKRQDDGALKPRLGYVLPAYPHPEYKFFYVWRSAIGKDIPSAWKSGYLMPNHAFWNLLPPEKPEYHRRQFGLGQAWHNPTERSSRWLRGFAGNLAQHIYFYEDEYPGMAHLARWLWQEMDYLRAGKFGAIPFWSEIWSPVEKGPRVELPEGLPLARHFDGNGTVLMRTGSGPADTYALFNPGGGTTGSPQFDATHFAIFKGGYLALDSGTRNAYPHMQAYYSQTVAHNAVLVRMPGEKFSGMYGGETDLNAAGQTIRPRYAKMMAFETTPLFAYAATDATATYNPQKCYWMTRQFVFLPPKHFVVFDIVKSTEPDYPKTWLLHTANDPEVDGMTFRADQGTGRIFCRTVYPPDANMEKIGGPGKEFVVDGENVPLTDAWWRNYGQSLNQEIPEVMGRWRVEVKPPEQRKKDFFLHLIEVSDQADDDMVDSTLTVKAMDPDDIHLTGSHLGVIFEANGRKYDIDFDIRWRLGPNCAGNIRITQGEQVLIDRPFTRYIMPQAGLALTK
jgi:heparin/heparan-sulfate lyase